MDYWCDECKEKLEYEDCEKSKEWYEAWGHEFYEEYLVCPRCKEAVVPYEHQEEEEAMDELKEIVEKLTEDICDNFCKFSGTGKDGQCVWCKINNDNCPLDAIKDYVEG